jgi:hypothetical protein
VYSLVIERLERHVLTERQIAAVMAVNSTKKVTLPTFEAERARLDRLLGEGPERRERDPEQAALIAALGLGG